MPPQDGINMTSRRCPFEHLPENAISSSSTLSILIQFPQSIANPHSHNCSLLAMNYHANLVFNLTLYQCGEYLYSFLYYKKTMMYRWWIPPLTFFERWTSRLLQSSSTKIDPGWVR